MPDESEAGDRFGAALQGRAQNALAIGVPGEDIGDVVDAGAVVDLAVPGGVSVTTTHWFQGGGGLAGVAEAGRPLRLGTDRPVRTACSRSARRVRMPAASRTSGWSHVIGLVMGHTTLSADADQQFRQDTRDVPGTAESGDQMGDALGAMGSTLVIGMSREDVHGAANAGALITLGFDEEQDPRHRRAHPADHPGRPRPVDRGAR